MIGAISQCPTLQLDRLGIIVADVDMLIRFLAAGAIVEDIDDLDISGRPRLLSGRRAWCHCGRRCEMSVVV